MRTAALIAWLLTIGGGATLATIWVAKGGLRQQEDDLPFQATGGDTSRALTNLPLWMVGSHALGALLALGIFVWFLLAGDGDQVGAEPALWLVLSALVVTAGIGVAMARRWSAARKRRRQGGPGTRRAAAADQSIPAPLVHGHGLIALVTIVLVVLVALDIGT